MKTLMCVLMLCAVTVMGQEAKKDVVPAPIPKAAAPAPSAPKFALSEVEQLKLDNLKLRIDAWSATVAQARDKYLAEINAFSQKTLADHGNPKDVVFDTNSFTFQVMPPKEEKKPEVPVKK